MNKITIFWFRRDLRLNDNAGLYHALKSGNTILPIFIFDKDILDKLSNKGDLRVNFIHKVISDLKRELNNLGSDLAVFYGKPLDVFKELSQKYAISAVFTNHDYEPYAIKRDLEVKDFLLSKAIDFKSFKDQVIFEKDEIVKDDGKPYVVYTPFSKAWKNKLNAYYLKPYPNSKYFNHFIKVDEKQELISLAEMGFEYKDFQFPANETSVGIIKKYGETRDFPAIIGTSRLGLHYRFGTISIREKAAKSLQLSEKYLNELIWREFYMSILYHFPHVVESSFRKEYDAIEWRNNENEFQLWCEGKTGYPIVDAGMRELNLTGYMHNRVRMIVASFLTKHLLIDWRWGEKYFAEKLLDFELASNNGGWQWAAGCGVDAAPYFRVFNPELQTEKFDPKEEYIKRWIPNYNKSTYIKPIVDHKYARNRVLEVYKAALKP